MRESPRTPERKALIIAEYPDAVDARAFLDRLNALPGPPVRSTGSVRQWAKELGVKKSAAALERIHVPIRQAGGQTMAAQSFLTPERADELRRLWPDSTVPFAEVLVRFNALPGPQIIEKASLYRYAKRLGLGQRDAVRTYTRQAKPTPVEVEEAPPPPVELTPEEEAAVADAAISRRYDKARQMIARKVPAFSVAGVTGLPLREVFRLVGEARR